MHLLIIQHMSVNPLVADIPIAASFFFLSSKENQVFDRIQITLLPFAYFCTAV